jgi:hypothetical protein
MGERVENNICDTKRKEIGIIANKYSKPTLTTNRMIGTGRNPKSQTDKTTKDLYKYRDSVKSWDYGQLSNAKRKIRKPPPRNKPWPTRQKWRRRDR